MSGYAWVPTSVVEDLAALANGDPYVLSVGLYTWTCRHKRATGVYYLPVEYVMTDLHYPRDEIARALQVLHAHHWACWDERSAWVFVREYAAHNLRGNGPGGTLHKNDQRLKAARAQLAEAQQRAPALAAEWFVVYDHLLPYEPARDRKIAAVGSRIQFDRGDQTVRRGPPLPLEGDPPSPSKGTPGTHVGWLEVPPQGTGTTVDTGTTAAGAAYHPVDTVENRPDGSEIQTIRSVAYQPDAEGDPPSPSAQAGLPLPLASVVVEQITRRGRSRDELAREAAPDGNRSMLRMFAYGAFDARFKEGFPAGGLTWDDVGTLVEEVKCRAAPLHVEYQAVRDAVDHAVLMRQKGVGGPEWKPTVWNVYVNNRCIGTVDGSDEDDAFRTARHKYASVIGSAAFFVSQR